MLSFRQKPGLGQGAKVVLFTEEQVKARKSAFPAPRLTSVLKDIVSAKQFAGKKGEMFPVAAAGCLFLFTGLGKENELSLTAVRICLRRALCSSFLKKIRKIEIVPHKDDKQTVRAVVEAVVLGTYSWKKYITRKKEDLKFEVRDFAVVAQGATVDKNAAMIAGCVNYTRDLVNENADVITAVYLEKKVRDLVRGKKDVSLDVLGRRELAARKFGLMLAVNQGSSKEPRLVIVKYTGAGKGKPYTALVGKGLTFDTGGLNLKTSGHIEDMRIDMSGAAAVIGTLKAVLALKPKKNLIFVMGMVENAIDANAYKPGDIIVGYAGKSVEIGNTDAEGRLVLADVLSYLVKNYKPARIVDLATLTGACIVALGNDYAGLVSNNESLAKALLDSAEATDDRLWRLPNYPELKDAMKSRTADIKNTSNFRGAGGTLTAAEFLRQFVGDTPWAHLDIAGTAFVDGDERLYYGHGATGYGVRLLTHFILND